MGREPRGTTWVATRVGAVLRRAHRFGPLTLLLVGLLAFTLGYTAIALAPPDHRIAAWWPAAGVAVLALAWVPARRRVALVAVLLVSTGLANYLVDRPLDHSVGFAVANTAEAVVAAWWLRRGRSRPTLSSLEDFSRLLVATLLGVVVMGLVAGTTVTLAGTGDPAMAARTVMASHGAAILVMAPFGLRVTSVRRTGRHLEVLAQTLGMALVASLVFAPGQIYPLSFLPLPLLVWAALRLGTRVVAGQLLLLSVLVTTLNSHGGGPFAAHAGSGATLSVSLVQAYLVVTTIVLLPLAISVDQRLAALRRVAANERLYRSGFSEAVLGMLLLRAVPSTTGGGSGTVATRGRPQGATPGAAEETTTAPDRAPVLTGLDVVELNAVAARILGRPEEDLVGRSWSDCVVPEERAALDRAVQAMWTGALPGWHGEVAVTTDDGRRWVEVALSPLPAATGEGMFVAQMVDVTARRAAEERLTAQALQDGLTGLANRTLLRDRIELALRTVPSGSRVAVLFCDLDDFKHVNDSAGHTHGDHVLVEVARRIEGVLRPDDLAARQGGDEFVLLRPHVAGPEEAEAFAAEVAAALGAPLVVHGREVVVGASIGIALGERPATPDDLLRDADAAMYAAKAEGKRRAVLYSDEHRARALRAVRVEEELRGAVDRGEVEVWYQPVVDVADDSLVAAEALVRWNHPERGVLAPAEWLDVAEASGQIVDVGAWVLRQACADAATWEVADGPRPVVHVNVSARQLELPGFHDLVREVLTETGLEPCRLVLEFTETYLDAVSDALLADLVALRDLGVRLAADDYGTGYSPLTRIIELPLSMIKIDRAFVGAMLDDVRSDAVVMSLLRLSEALDLELVAEGVETQQQADELRRLGCRAAQGYLWSRPVPSAEFRARFVEVAVVG